MKPFFDDGGGRVIYLGDGRDVLPMLPAHSVDLIASDPPYGVGYVTSRRLRTDPLVVPIHNDDSLNILRDTLPMIDRLLKDDRHAYLFAAPLRIGEVLEVIEQFWKVKNVLVWDKGDSGTVGDLKAGYAWNWEPIVYAMKGRRDIIGPRPRCIYRYDWSGTRDPVHPTVKPVGLMQWLLAKSSLPGETVLDPFMGSGVTMRAAKNLGMRCIGIELDEKYAEIAARRLSQEVMALDA